MSLSDANISSYHGSAMYVDVIRCRKPCNREWWKVVVAEEDRVNHGSTSCGVDICQSLRIADVNKKSP